MIEVSAVLEWGEMLPAHWRVSTLKRLCQVYPSNVDKKSYDNDETVLLCNYTDVYHNERITGRLPFMQATATAEQINRFTLRAGDTIITKDSETADDIAIPSYVPDDLPGVVCGYHLAVVRPRDGTDGAFISWWFRSTSLKASARVRANGLTRVGLGQHALDNLSVPVPPLPEQTAIAAFLDRETGKIDALVGEQKRLIELLKEKRQAVISRAVTKGLDPNAPMKPSGVKWLGDVPEHWEVGPLKRYWSVTDCKHITADFIDDGLPLVSIREAQSKYVDLSEAKKTTKAYYDLLIEGGRKPKPGDLILTRNATVGQVAQVADWHPPFAMGQDVCLLRRLEDGSITDFTQYMLRSSPSLQQLSVAMVGATFKRVNVEDIRNLVFAWPSADQQQHIAEYLNHNVSKIDALISEATALVAILQERRSALISAAITGKIAVRAIAVQGEPA